MKLSKEQPKKGPSRSDVLKAKYEHFVKSGGSGRQNTNDVLKALVEVILDEEAYTAPPPKPAE